MEKKLTYERERIYAPIPGTNVRSMDPRDIEYQEAFNLPHTQPRLMSQRYPANEDYERKPTVPVDHPPFRCNSPQLPSIDLRERQSLLT